MSHIVTIQCKIHDHAAIAAACRRLNLAAPLLGKAKLYGGEVAGLLVHLPGWTYPVVIVTTTGNVRYDNFEGCWKR